MINENGIATGRVLDARPPTPSPTPPSERLSCKTVKYKKWVSFSRWRAFFYMFWTAKGGPSVEHRPFLSFPFRSVPFLSVPFLSFTCLFFLFLPFPPIPFPSLSFPVLSCSFLSFHFLSFPVPSFVFSKILACTLHDCIEHVCMNACALHDCILSFSFLSFPFPFPFPFLFLFLSFPFLPCPFLSFPFLSVTFLSILGSFMYHSFDIVGVAAFSKARDYIVPRIDNSIRSKHSMYHMFTKLLWFCLCSLFPT